MLKKVRIPLPEKRLGDYPHQFSGGMRQRVMIAMALSCNPQLLIADEPTTALDVTIQAQVLELMADLQRETGAAIILITHDLGVVAEFCRNVMVMYGGNMVEYGTAEQIFSQPRMPYTQGLLASLPRLDEGEHRRLEPIPGQPPNLLRLPPGCAFARRCTYRMPICDNPVPLYDFGAGHVARCYLYDERAREQRPAAAQDFPTLPAGSPT
jgi:oligopeptide/dipeptide ABC transporter ATP-binding protein